MSASPRPVHRPQRTTRRQATAAKQTADRPASPRETLPAQSRSQAVRLPKDLCISGSDLTRPEGNRRIPESVNRKGWPAALWEQIDELASEFANDWQRPADLAPPLIRRGRDLP